MAEHKPSNVVNLRELRRSCASCALQQLCLPASIGGDDLQRLDTLVRQRRPMDSGSALFRENDAFGLLYVVRSGSFKTFVALPEGDTQILGFHLPGEIIGLDALGDGHHHCTAASLERSSVCEVPFTHLTEIAAQIPGLQRQLYRVISREFVQEQQHLVMMGRKQAQTRLAIFLRSLSDRFRILGHDPFDFNLGMSRQDLANYLGLVIETVSRLFTRFQAQEILKVERKRIQIINPPVLAMIAAQGEPDEGLRKVG